MLKVILQAEICSISYTVILPNMPVLCSMLSGTHYTQNYASIIGWYPYFYVEVVNLRNCLRLNLRVALISLGAHTVACMIAIKLPFPLRACMHYYYACTVFILGMLGWNSPLKISDSPSKVVSDLVTATLHQFIELISTKNAFRFNLRATNMQDFQPWLQIQQSLLCQWWWASICFFFFFFFFFCSSTQ